MKVLKFGGTSVGSVNSILSVKKIVEAIEEPVIVVVSALGGITDKLLATSTMASKGDLAYEKELSEIIARHLDVIEGVIEAKDAGRIVATTKTGALRIRKEPSADAAIYDLLEEGAKYEVVDEEQIRFSEDQEITADWVAVNYGGKTGYVSSEYVQVDFEIDYGETVEQVKAREEAETARLQAEKEAAAQKQKQEKAAQAEREANKAAALAADDSVLLAALIQCEAGEEPYEGQVAVGAVVMNRVRSGAYPNTVKGVIYASGQFTPAGSGQVGRVVASGKIKASCLQAAQEAMAGSTPVGIATHFRRAGSREGIVIGHHVFW